MLTQANPAKNEGPKESDGADKRYTRNELLQLARIADNTERYEDMAKVRDNLIIWCQ